MLNICRNQCRPWPTMLLVLCIMMFQASIASGDFAVYDAAIDFALANNPNGAWSYGYSTTLRGTMTPFTLSTSGHFGNPYYISWHGTQGDGHPGVFKNTATTTQQALGSNLEAGKLGLHPGPSGNQSIVRWTAPIASRLLIDSVFEGRGNNLTAGTTTDVHVLLNGASLFDGEVIGFRSTVNFDHTVVVLPGDHIDFVVGYGTNNDYNSDTTGLAAKLTATGLDGDLRLDALISSGDTWSYRDDGSNQGTAWRQPGFNDSAWYQGETQFGYGDGDEYATIDCGPGLSGDCSPGNGLSNNFATTYFRFTAELDALYLSTIENLSARILRDDGAAVYVNGVEVYRDVSLRPGAAYNELANFNGAEPIGGVGENEWHQFSIDPALLYDGLNVIAVEVHQHNANSSDVSFDFELTALVAVVPEPASWFLAAWGLVAAAISVQGRRVKGWFHHRASRASAV